MADKKENEPLGALFTDLKNETTSLIQKELELFRIEMGSKITQIVKDVAALGVGGVMLHTGMLTLVAALVLGIACFIAAWLSALLVGVFLCLVGVLLLMKGKKDLSHLKMSPEKTTQSLKETAKWAKSEMK